MLTTKQRHTYACGSARGSTWKTIPKSARAYGFAAAGGVRDSQRPRARVSNVTKQIHGHGDGGPCGRTATSFRPRTHARRMAPNMRDLSKQILVCMHMHAKTDGQDLGKDPSRWSLLLYDTRAEKGAASKKTTTPRLSGGVKITAASARST
jgi:hypothetical protein